MANTNNGTGSGRSKMDLSKLDETIEALHEYVGGDSDEISLSKEQAAEAARLLEYFAEKTENNRLYHKKQNVKRNIALKALERLLSADEMKEIDRQASEAIGDVRNPNEGTSEEETE